MIDGDHPRTETEDNPFVTELKAAADQGVERATTLTTNGRPK